MAKEKKHLVKEGFRNRSITNFILVCGVIALTSHACGASALSDAVVTLSSSTDVLSKDTTTLDANVSDLIQKYRMTNAGACALLVIGNSSTNSAPLYFIPGQNPTAVLQADIIVGPGITITGITAGPITTTAGKSIQSAPVPGGERFVLIGLNQTTLRSGVVAMVNFDLTGASVGPHIVALTNFVGGDTAGNSIPMCVTTGVITK